MLNGKGFELEEFKCPVCGYVYLAAVNDPTDKCECPSEDEHAVNYLTLLVNGTSMV